MEKEIFNKENYKHISEYVEKNYQYLEKTKNLN